MSGGFSYGQSQFNRATQARASPARPSSPSSIWRRWRSASRRPPSCWTRRSTIDQGPASRSGGRRTTRERLSRARCTLRVGLEQSRNLMTVRLAHRSAWTRSSTSPSGSASVDKLQPYLADALGAGETTVLSLTTAYAMLVNGGKKIKPTWSTASRTAYGKTIYRTTRAPATAASRRTVDGQPGGAATLPDTREPVDRSRARPTRWSPCCEGVVAARHRQGRVQRSASRWPARPAPPTTARTPGSSASRPTSWSASLSASTSRGRSAARRPAARSRCRSGSTSCRGAARASRRRRSACRPGSAWSGSTRRPGSWPSRRQHSVIAEAFMPGTEPGRASMSAGCSDGHRDGWRFVSRRARAAAGRAAIAGPARPDRRGLLTTERRWPRVQACRVSRHRTAIRTATESRHARRNRIAADAIRESPRAAAEASLTGTRRCRLDELNALSEDPEALERPRTRAGVMRERNRSGHGRRRPARARARARATALELTELAEEEGDEATIDEAEADSAGAEGRGRPSSSWRRLLSGEADANDAFLEVNAGAGGTETQDWAEMLLRMYLRWAEQHGYKVEWLEESAGEEAGIKSATSRSRARTPMAGSRPRPACTGWCASRPSTARRGATPASPRSGSIPVIDDEIEIEILDKDLRIDTYRASGAGGQHVNKTDFGRAHHPPPDRHRRRLPERPLAAPEPRQGHGHAARPALRARAAEARGRGCRRSRPTRPTSAGATRSAPTSCSPTRWSRTCGPESKPARAVRSGRRSRRVPGCRPGPAHQGAGGQRSRRLRRMRCRE